jgi:crossover junction endodeoxyribonuclease RusA
MAARGGRGVEDLAALVGAMISFQVRGLPAPQGSKRHVGNGRMVESSKRVAPWRQDVREEAMKHAPGSPLAGGLCVTLGFYLPVPKSAPKKRRLLATKRPDIDKLARAVLDALTSAGVYRDDSQVVELKVEKQLAYDVSPGVEICITERDAL